MAINPATQIQYESGVRMRYGIFLFAAAILLVAAGLVPVFGVKSYSSEVTLFLIRSHERFPLDLIGSVVTAIGLVAFGLTIRWLARITRARDAGVPGWIGYVVLIGAGLLAFTDVAFEVAIAVQSHKFVTTGLQSYPEARRLYGGSWLSGLEAIQLLGLVSLYGGFIWTCMNAMRVGLLTKWVGYSSIFVGALQLLPIGGITMLVQAFWLLAAALLISGRNPSGDLPAWVQGTAVPWGVTNRGAFGRTSPMREPRQPRQPRPSRQQRDAEVIDAVSPTPDYASRRKRKKR